MKKQDEAKITKEKVLEAAEKCSTAKATLQILFPDFFKPKPISDITSFEIACKKQNLNPTVLIKKWKSIGLTKDEIAYKKHEKSMKMLAKKLKIFIKALVGNWKPDYANKSQEKWYIVWVWDERSSGFVLSGSNFYNTHTRTTVGARLSFPSQAIAIFAAGQIPDIWNDWLSPA